MRKHKTGFVAAVAALALPAAALAQTLDRASLHEVDDDDGLAYQNVTVDDLEDYDVVRDGREIGEVEEVLANDRDEVVAVAVEFDDDALEMDDVEVIIPLEQLELDPGAEHAITTMTDDELRALPIWDD